MRRALLCPSLVLMAALAAAPTLAQTITVPQPAGPIALDHDADRDAAIANRIEAIIGALEGYEGVDVSVTSGVVTLRGETLDFASRTRLEQIVSRVEGVAAFRDEVTAAASLRDAVTVFTRRMTQRLQQAVLLLPVLAVAVAAFAGIVVLGRILSAPRAIWDRIAPNPFISGIYRQIVRLVFLFAALIVALDVLGATALLGSILGAAGIIGLAIGFAVRDTVENFIASVMLSIRQPFQPMDLIEIGGDVGKVVRLTSRATILMSLDGNLIRVPNATVFKSRIVNFSRNPETRLTFAIDIDPEADMGALREAAQTKLAALPFVLDTPPPAVWIHESDGSDVQLDFAAWIDQTTSSYDQARGEAIRVLRAFVQAEGALRPPPISRVYTMDDAEAAMRRGPVAAADLAPERVATLDTVQEASLDRMVAAARAETGAEDLLARRAPRE